MSLQDMARSHVKELAREAFGLDEVVVDEDGDLPFPYGTAMVYVSVVGQVGWSASGRGRCAGSSSGSRCCARSTRSTRGW